jgi:hypothetical protein
MSSWVEKRAGFEQRKNQLQSYINNQYDNDVREFNRAAKSFVEALGMDGSPNPAAGKDGGDLLKIVYDKYNTVKNSLKNVQRLKDEITEYIIGISNAGDVQQVLQQIGSLQLEVNNLEDKIKDLDVMDEAAKDRADAIANRYKDVSRQQLLTTIDRPLEKRSYIYLFPISISLFVLAIFLLWPGVKSILSLPATIGAGAMSIDLPFYKKSTFVYSIMGLMASAVVVTILIITGVIH